jgi:hypothetical protein
VKPATLGSLQRREQRIQERLAKSMTQPRPTPMFTARNIHYEVDDRTNAISCAGIGAIHQMVRAIGLIEILDADLHLLKVHQPYHESDHVLNLAYNIISGGKCLEDLERNRTNEVLLDALGTDRTPDPTTAGDFCRRFSTTEPILILMEAINKGRLNVWKQQPAEFFNTAELHVDGTIAATTGECKQGMDMSYDCQWSYHPMAISLAQTKEVLYLVNRSGNRPSHEHAGEYLDKSIELCRKGGFGKILMLGDTDFTQTSRLDGWDDAGDVKFIFGFNAIPKLKQMAAGVLESDWKRLARPARYQVKTQERAKPENVKQRIVRERGYKNLVLVHEDVAEFSYKPGKCTRNYRIVVLRKLISVEKGQEHLFKSYRYFFYITNEREMSAEAVVFKANDRCNQENLIEQLKNGVHAMRNPLDNLHSNWAYMVMVSLAWTLKCWCGLLLPAAPKGNCQDKQKEQREALLKMEFKRFVNSLINLPCQIVKTGGKIVYRLLSWNPWAEALVRLSEAMRVPMRC